jgi:hypothetical protein
MAESVQREASQQANIIQCRKDGSGHHATGSGAFKMPHCGICCQGKFAPACKQNTHNAEERGALGLGNVSAFRMIASTVSAVYPYLVTFFVVYVQFKFG